MHASIFLSAPPFDEESLGDELDGELAGPELLLPLLLPHAATPTTRASASANHDARGMLDIANSPHAASMARSGSPNTKTDIQRADVAQFTCDRAHSYSSRPIMAKTDQTNA